MTAILNGRADLLWFGGIGTYVRGSARPMPMSATGQ
jgi:NAD-specific glutamate dehydrogenase